jgi:hypothetical protein
MFGRSIFLVVVLAKLVSGRDEASSVREREDALAKALNARDKVGLLTLTDKDFHVDWKCGSVVRSFSTVVPREDWIDNVIQLRIDSYEAKISKVRLLRVRRADHESPSNDSMADVTVDEFWTIHSPRGSRIEKRFLTKDTWVKLQGTWKLAVRIYAPHPCPDDPYWPSLR